MKIFLPTTLFLLTAVCIRTDSPAQDSAFAEPAVEQIGFTALYPCSGACDESSLPRAISVLMDVDGSHLIPMAVGAWSPDGMRLLFAGNDVYTMPAVGGAEVNLTNHPANYLTPAWSPDGTRIAFASDRDGPLALYVMTADGSDVVQISTGVGMAWHPTWSPDSARLAFACIVDPVSFPWWSAIGNHEICAVNADGSGFARLTNDPAGDDDPDWSPDGARIVFSTGRYGGSELAVMSPDGTNVIQISPGLQGTSPRWSSDGSRLAFVFLLPWDPDAPWLMTQLVSIMNADGTGFTSLEWGHSPVWRPWAGGSNDRPVASFTSECSGFTCAFDGSASSDSDGTITGYGWQFGDGTIAAGASVTHTFSGGHDVRLIVMDDRGALGTSVQNVNQPPVVSFTSACNGLTCSFDGSASFDPDGTIAGFMWRFGDLKDGSAPAINTHTYTAAGTYIVGLTATDSDSGTTTYSQSVTVVGNVNVVPVASFTSACNGLTCSFNGSGSSDVDGTITSYEWDLGDQTIGSDVVVTHAYAVPGTYTVTLMVTDNTGGTSTQTRSILVTSPPLHVGDLDRSTSSQPNVWSAAATVTVHDGGHLAVVNAVVTGVWNDGSVMSCTTNAFGRCTVTRAGIPRKTSSVSFSVMNVVLATFVYRPADNHDPDGESDGTTIAIRK
jgi:PKD repeat protein